MKKAKMRYNTPMKIKKLGHCCLLIQTKGVVILTDPGSYTIDEHSKLTGIDFVLFTHEHEDHFHLDSLKALLVSNPAAKVYANSSVGGLLTEAQIPHTVVKFGDTLLLAKEGGEGKVGDEASTGVQIKGIGERHAIMHSSIPPSANLGFYIDEKLWYPGDSFTDPRVYMDGQIEVLALPVAGPWMKISEAIDYALMIKPKACFPVHDGLRLASQHALPEKILTPEGIVFKAMVEGDEEEF